MFRGKIQLLEIKFISEEVGKQCTERNINFNSSLLIEISYVQIE